MKNSLLFLTLLFAICITAGAQTAPDLILFNGKIFTSDVTKPNAEAVAVLGDRILAVGSNAEIKKTANGKTRLIDLEGRTVVPGFNDAHAHFGPTFQGVDLELKGIEPSWDETAAALRATAAGAPKGKWIFGTIGGISLNDPRATRATLDAISPGNPVFLSTYFGHGSVFNSRAMQVLNLTDSEPDPAGGRFEHDAESKALNGRVFEYANWNLQRRLAEAGTDAELIAEMKKRAARAVSFGVTSMQVMPFIATERYVRLLNKAELPLRIRAIAFSRTTTRGREMSDIQALAGSKSASKNVSISGIKWILDGTPIERGAALRRDYNDKPGWRGTLNFPEAEIENMVRESLRFNQPLILHCVGDRACGAVLDAMEKVGGGKVNWKEKRVRLEHGEMVLDDLVERAKKLGVVIVQNPTHFTDVEMGKQRWGGGKSRIRTFVEEGIPFALGSDGPLNPFLNIMLASIHPDNPSQAISREQAVMAYTRGSAFAEFAEKEKGVISKGMLADLAVLSHDIFTLPADILPGTSSVLTIVGGKVVHDAGVLR